MRVVRILQVFGSLNVGGAETRTMEIFRNIDRDLFQFDFISMEKGDQFFEDEIRSLNGNIYKIESPRSSIFKNFRSLCRVMKNNNYDAVHAHTSYHCGLVLKAAASCNIPIRIAHARTAGSIHRNIVDRVQLYIGRQLISKYATSRIAISEEAAKFLYGQSGEGIRIIPNSIDTSLYEIVQNVEQLYHDFQIKKEDILIGHVGRFQPMKNHKFLIDIFPSILESIPKAKLVLIGEGPLSSNIKAAVKHAGLDEYVLFCGVRDDVYKWMQMFSCVIMPSIYEGLGGVAIEAQAAGRACVLSQGIPQKETDLGLGLCEYLSLSDDKSDWVKAVERAIDKPHPSQYEIKMAFKHSGYLLASGIKAISQIYMGESQ